MDGNTNGSTYIKINKIRKLYLFVFFILLFIFIIFSIYNPSGFFTSSVNADVYVSLFLITCGMILLSYYRQPSDNSSNDAFTLFNRRQRILLLLMVTIVIIVSLMVFNPNNIGVNYSSVWIILLSLSIFFGTIYFVVLSKSEDSENTFGKTLQKLMFYFMLYSIPLVIFVIFITIIIKIIDPNDNSQSLLSNVIKYGILFILLGVFIKYVILKYLETSTQTNSTFSKIIKYLFYIPCFLVYVTEEFVNQYKITKRIDIYVFLFLLLLCCILILTYLFYPYFAKKYFIDGGNLLLNNPVSLNKETTVGSYLSIYGDNINTTTQKYNNYYKYSISFWFFIDSYPPNTSDAYKNDVNILNYNYNPIVTYKGVTNTLTVSLVDLPMLNKCSNNTKNDISECIDKLSNKIYQNKNIKLQKWNNMVLVFNSSTLDIFYNNELVKSGIGMPNISNLNPIIAGEENGINGGICNIIYFKKNIGIDTINQLYHSVESKNPPIGDYNFSIL